MRVWSEWWKWAGKLRAACSRERTFMWMLVAIIGFSIRDDLLGVTSFIRCIGLQSFCYDRLLDFFHTPALSVVELARIWTSAVIGSHPGIVRHAVRPILLCDGIKIGKSGRKMPGVKRLHQESESNSKPDYIMGHSCQAICVLAGCLASVVAIPLAARIHEGVVFSNRDKRTTLDKMAALISELGITEKFILICTDTTIDPLEVIRLYGLRFKIEVSFKQSIHTIGAYLYHFWMDSMTPVRRGSGDQYLHRKTEEYRKAIRRKIEAYHRFIQVGLVAQGIMAAISTSVPHAVWESFGSWIRTIRPNVCPSEMVVSLSMKNSFPQFLMDKNTSPILAKFIIERIDFSRNNRSQMVA